MSSFDEREQYQSKALDGSLTLANALALLQ
jgi:hypothetical protein